MCKTETRKFNFTKRTLEAPPPPKGKRELHYDVQTRGLGVMVRPTGHRAFFWFRKVRGRPTWQTIGDFPDLSVENARARATDLNSKLAAWKAGGYSPFVDPNKRASWEDTASYSVALAGVLSLVARPHLGLGATPLIAATAPTRRSGKTKMIEAVCAAALGHKPTAAHFTDEEELGKHLPPLMRVGERAILIDNVARTLQSAKLCILITGGMLRDRVLGESRDVVLKNYAVLFATGNNLVVGGDLSAKTIRADIDPGLERPEARAFGFDPVARAIERHPRLAVAALTALRAYLLMGSPWTPKREPWGGFEQWDNLVCGCLTCLEYADPYESRERVIGDDPIRSENSGLLEEWHAKYGRRPVSLDEVRKNEGPVYDALLKDGRWDGHHAKWVLRRIAGQVIGGYRLERLDGRSRFRVLGPHDRQGSLVLCTRIPGLPKGVAHKGRLTHTAHIDRLRAQRKNFQEKYRLMAM